MARLALPGVTLCAVTSVNVAATLVSLARSMAGMDFGACLLFTDAANLSVPAGVQVVPIAPITSAAAYSEFVIRELHQHLTTDHVLVSQWDGFVINPERWDPAWLDCDYIGALWPQFADGACVGNGGFSLRSRKLRQACRDPGFAGAHPEDTTICRRNRTMLERSHAIRFADPDTAQRFSYERQIPDEPTFGFHGAFNMIAAIGADPFWQLYLALDDRRTVFADFVSIARQLGSGSNAVQRRVRFAADYLRFKLLG